MDRAAGRFDMFSSGRMINLVLGSASSSFQQSELEPFYEAWERFEDYVQDFPHHGYPEEQLIGIFYDEADWRFRIALDSGSDGSFMTKTVDEARELINNLTSSNNNNCPKYDRSRGRVSNLETRKIDALSDKLELLLRRDQKHVNRIDEINEEDDDQEEIQYLNGQNRPTYYRSNFAPAYRGNQGDNAQGPPCTYQGRTYPLQGQGFQKAFNQNQGMQGKSPYIGERSDSNTNRYQPPQQNNQFQPTTGAPTLTPSSRTDELFQQILAGQQRLDNMHNHVNVKLNGITNHVGTLERNLEEVTLHVRKLDTQVAQIAEAMKRSTGELPGKPEQNPRGREFVNSVVQNNEESSAQCNTLIAQKQNLERKDVADATTNLKRLNFARGTN